ncbi:MAG: orotidine-5'-phosphate decarboxylase [Candidatus Kapaibacteriales bacterium]
MNSYTKILNAQIQNKSRLCIGLDPDPDKIPAEYISSTDKILDYIKLIIDLTKNYVCAYKINFAFFEQFGSKGYQILEKILTFIPDTISTIADVKRSDISNSAKFYAKSVYEHFQFDCVTLNPLLGKDSLDPFFDYQDKLNFVLILTSNAGTEDFLKLFFSDKFLFEILLEKVLHWYNSKTCGLVVGATKPKDFSKIRQFAPDYFILAPGIGTQGGDLNTILKANQEKPLIINVSRDIIYPNTPKFSHNYIINKTEEYWNSLKL